jgi:glutathione synthetase
MKTTGSHRSIRRHSTHVIRLTFHQLAEMAEIRNLDRALLISTPTNPQLEISVVYYRAGYTPTDYPTSTEFETRIKLERSRAIKCPSIALQLAGGKKVQEVLTQPGVLESFLFDPHYRFKDKESFTEEDLKLMRETWMEMWGLDSVDSQGETGVAKAERRALDLVLKPQREGGGNNVYKSSIPGFLKTLPEKEREAWIAMELIKPPVLNNLLVKAGEGSAVLTDSVSELGIFGWALFGGSEIGIKQDTAGWILRTKGRESDEGGVAVGFSVLDSVVLID